MLALIRDDAVNLPLFLHVLGAMLLAGSLFTVVLTSALVRRADGERSGLRRLGFRTVLLGVFPSYLLMRIGAQWTESEEGLATADESPAWLTIGYITADLGALLTLASVVISVVGLRKLRSRDPAALHKAIGIIAAVLLVAYVVTIWAMSAKPA